MTLNILILEDDARRMGIFMAKLGTRHRVTAVDTAAAAIELLEKEVFDIIFLDHDLGGQTYVSAEDKNTGSEVVRWMCKNMEYRCHVIIHSLNTPEAKAMYDKLDAINMVCQRIPFTQLNRLLDDPSFISES